MENLQGKTAFITGGASGIGLAMGRAFGAAGMNVMLADIDEAALQTAVKELSERQIRVEGVRCDVVKRDSMAKAAQATLDAFGKVHVICNNAGVGVGGPIDSLTPKDWDWILAVNVMGVVHGMEVFLPHLRAHGEGAHVVNTASMAGMISPPGMEPYNATKFAVVALSEGWAAQLAGENIGVSVLCPGFVKTRIHESGRARQAEYGGSEPDQNEMSNAAQFVLAGIDPDIVGACVVDAVRHNDLYIFTHPDMKPAVEERFRRILEAFDRNAERPALQGVAMKSPQAVNMLSEG